MKINSKDQESIVTLLTEIYLEIADIEVKYKLIAGKGDVRPRIDYFHDAVRAFTSEGIHHPRLCVELLAYDLQCLRYVAKTPLAPFQENEKSYSPSQEIITTNTNLVSLINRPDHKIRTRISELYQHYAVMFAALLKPSADYDFQERTETLDNNIRDVQAIIYQFETEINVNIITKLAQHLEEGELRIILITFLQQQKQKNKADIKKLLGHLRNYIKQKDAMMKSIDKAHLVFATVQLGIFEDSKELLKKLATQGTNLVGKFVEASIANTRKQMGR